MLEPKLTKEQCKLVCERAIKQQEEYNKALPIVRKVIETFYNKVINVRLQTTINNELEKANLPIDTSLYRYEENIYKLDFRHIDPQGLISTATKHTRFAPLKIYTYNKRIQEEGTRAALTCLEINGREQVQILLSALKGYDLQVELINAILAKIKDYNLKCNDIIAPTINIYNI